MGRQSPKTKNERSAKVQTQDRSDAIRQMNGALKKKLAKCEKMIGDSKSQNLKFYWQLGREIVEVKQNADGKYGAVNPYRLMESAMFSNRRQMRKAAAFAKLYTVEQLQALIDLRHGDSEFQLHWGHVSYLLTLNTTHQRETWAAKAVRNMWDPPALSAQIIAHFGHKTNDPHGRPHKMPDTVHLQIRQILDKSADWTKKFDNVWNGSTSSVIANILSEPPDELTDVDLENLQEIMTVLPELQLKASELLQQVGRVTEHVAGIMEARKSQSQQAEEAGADLGKEGRSLQLDSPTPGKRRRRKQKATV